MSEITPQGFVRTRLDERVAALNEAMRVIFGQDINLDPESPDGQIIGLFAESVSNLDQLAEDTYHSFNPQSATGLSLSRLVQFNGIKRLAGAYATVTLRAVGSQGTVIPAGSVVSSATTGVKFQTLADATIGGTGQADIAARAIEFGAVVAQAGTLTSIDTPIFGWQTVTNLLDAVPGRDEETDEQLRVRRANSTATPGLAIVDAIYGAIANLTSVLHVVVYENDQDVADPITGQDAHSIYAIVDGGDNTEIATVIFQKKTIGTKSLGDVVVAIPDSQGIDHDIRFARPIDVPLYIEVTLQTRTGWPVDGEQRIKDALVAWGQLEQSIGEEVIYSRLYSPVNSVPGSSVTALTVGTAPSPTGTVNVPIDFNEIARIDSSRITVNVVP